MGDGNDLAPGLATKSAVESPSRGTVKSPPLAGGIPVVPDKLKGGDSTRNVRGSARCCNPNPLTSGANAMTLVIPDEFLEASRMTESEFKAEVAVMLFQKGKLTMGQASRLAGLHTLAFQRLLASRDVPIHYDLPEFEADLGTLRDLGRL
jgi:predicted HTH domain antitoxin